MLILAESKLKLPTISRDYSEINANFREREVQIYQIYEKFLIFNYFFVQLSGVLSSSGKFTYESQFK